MKTTVLKFRNSFKYNINKFFVIVSKKEKNIKASKFSIRYKKFHFSIREIYTEVND